MKLKEIIWRKSEEEKKENRRREELRDRKEREEIWRFSFGGFDIKRLGRRDWEK